MFEVPGSDVKTVHITEDSVRGGDPDYIRQPSNANSTSSNDPNSTSPNASSSTEEEESTKVRVKQ